MPELTAVHFGLLVLMLVIGAAFGWILRSDRCAKEKIAVSARWQDQLESQQSEHNRLAEQNKSLMEQISQYQASQKDYSSRAKELSDSLREAFSRRDDLQRQLKDTRSNLAVAIAQRDHLQIKNENGQVSAIKEKDDKIFRLSRELTSWQNRVPPLVERYQVRDKQAHELQEELNAAQSRLSSLEEMIRSDHTRIEPLNADSLPDGGDASNEPIAVTSYEDASTLQDQIDSESNLHEVFGRQAADFTNVDLSIDDVELAKVFSDSDDNVVSECTVPAPVDDTDDSADDEASEQSREGANDSVEIEPPVKSQNAAEPDRNLAQNGMGDDLKMIKGIGPSIEKTLHGLGIFRFHQIAEMSEVEIDRVAQQLRGFRSRIYREDWIGQARDFQFQKNNDNA